MIRLESVNRRFGAHLALDDVSFEVQTGQTLGLVGAGGSGKSLILKAICGLMPVDGGRVTVGEDEVTALSETALMAVRSRIGMVFQNYALFDFMNVGANIGFPLTQLGTLSPDEVAARVVLRLSQVGLPGIEDRLPGELSGGMKKRVCLARAMIHDPAIMLCDDPTAGLDPVTTNRIFALLKALQTENAATAIIVSHEVDDLRPICDEFVMLDQGKVVFQGAAALAEVSDNPMVRAFFTGEGIS